MSETISYKVATPTSEWSMLGSSGPNSTTTAEIGLPPPNNSTEAVTEEPASALLSEKIDQYPPDTDHYPASVAATTESVPAKVVETVAAIERPAAREYTPEDRERVKRTAKEFPDFLSKSYEALENETDRETILAARNNIKQQTEKFRKELGEEFASLELSPEDQAEIEDAVNTARQKAISQTVDQLYPQHAGVNRKERKQDNRTREGLERMLTMSDAEFGQLVADWEHYDTDQAHGVALKEDKKYNRKAEHAAARGELARLDSEYGGVMAEVSAMPLDRSPEGSTQQTLGSYLSTQAEIGQKDPLKQEVLQKANLSKAVKSLQESLKAGYLAQGLTEAQVQSKLTETASALRKWIEAQDGSTNALADLERYGLQRNKEAMLATKQQKVREYLGPTVLKQVFGNLLRGEKAPSLVERINLAAELNRSIDQSGSRRRAGAAALRNSGRIGSLWGRVVTQLETARNLGRNEGTLMKSRLYITAMERGLGDSLVTAWEAIPESEKKKAREKWALGKAAAAASLKKLAAKAAQKANVRA